MPTRDLVIVFVVLCVVVFVVFAYFFPAEESQRRRRRRIEELPPETSREEKEWREAALRLKENVIKHQREIEDLEKEVQKLKELLKGEEEKGQKIEEKLKREKQWLADQEVSMERRSKEARHMKIELTKAQTDREHEYSLRLAGEREKKGIQEDFEKLTKEKNDLLLKVTNLEFNLRTQKEELLDLKKANAGLQKKKDEEQWVAKSEFEKLEKQLKEKEKEIQKLHDDWKR